MEHKRGEETQRFFKIGGWGQAKSRGGDIKKGGRAGTPLRTMAYKSRHIFWNFVES